MSEFRTKLIALGRGKASVREVSDALQTLVDTTPDAVPRAQQLLDAALKAGMPASVYTNLTKQIPTEDETVFGDAHWPDDETGMNADPAIADPGDGTAGGSGETLPHAVDPATDRPPEQALPGGVAGRDDETMLRPPLDDSTGLNDDSTRTDARNAPFRGGEPAAFLVTDPTVVRGAAGGTDETVVRSDRRVLAAAAPDPSPSGGESTLVSGEETVMRGADEATRFSGAATPAPRPDRDATEDGTIIASRALAVDDDRTAYNPNRPADATNPDGADVDKTLVTQKSIHDAFDILSDDALSAAEQSAARADAGPTQGDWESRPLTVVTPALEFKEGTLLRNRFILETKLGEGGMGAVWKGVDKLKQEARDRNPYVAIKLLQGDFKDHPEAFIALQRETSKQQRLAHPNIATVYDFDRDDATSTVFMTMEVLTGTDLAGFIRRNVPPGGLEYDDAMTLIRQLGSGLAHAHSHDLVHSDLKPGNCFVTEENTVKLLDFGIARASKTKADAEGETTIFDPGDLGALTPAYATIEMFDGVDPDPRDDIYAMAIIAYQLFTGKHPYGKTNAPKAEAGGLTVPPVAKLNKSQNRALAQGLAFRRDERTPTVEEFLQGLEPKTSQVWLWATAATIIAVLASAVGWPIIRDMQNAAEREEIIARIAQPATMQAAFQDVNRLESEEQRRLILEDDTTRNAVARFMATGDEASINQGLALVRSVNEKFVTDIKAIASVQDAVVNLYRRKARAHFDPSAGKYDYASARTEIENLKRIYQRLANTVLLEQSFEEERVATLAALQERFDTHLADGKLIRKLDEEDVFDIRDLVAQIDSSHPVLSSKLLPLKAAEFVSAAIEDADFEQADALLRASLEYAPDESSLADLRFQVEQELERRRNEVLVAEIESRLHAREAQFTTLEAFQAVRDDLIKLADLAPDSDVLVDLRDRLTVAFDREIAKDVAARRWPRAESLLVDFAKLFPLEYLDVQRDLLSAAERAAGYELPMNAERQAKVDARRARLDELLRNPRFDSEWEIALQVPFKEMIALVPSGHAATEPVRKQIADGYIAQAEQARSRRLTSQAKSLTSRGETFYPGYAGFAAQLERIAVTDAEIATERREAERVARVERSFNQVVNRANTLDASGAESALAILENNATSAEADRVAEARASLAIAYGQLARSPAAKEEWGQALRLVARGLELSPDSTELARARNSYDAEYQKVRDVEDLKALLQDKQPLNAAELRKRLDSVARDFPERFEANYLAEFARLAAARFDSLAVATESDLRIAAAEAAAVRRLFGARVGNDAQTLLERRMLERVAALLGRDVNAAARYRTAALRIVPESRRLNEIRIDVPSALAERGRSLVRERKLTEAATVLRNVLQNEPDAPNVPALRNELATAKSRAEAEFARYKRAGRSKRRLRYLNAALAIWADNPSYLALRESGGRASAPAQRNACTTKKAGLGLKSRATCWDDITAGNRGPTLVVIPPGGGISTPFAIGKLEVSVADYNLFCRSGGGCTPLAGDGKLPATRISVRDAEAYATWLSSTTSANYRLPTDAEWEHAANAGGKQPASKNVNCTVTVGNQVLKGQSLRTALSGRPNGWGLINYVGNAKEWVRSGSGIVARGGAYTDPMAKCAIGLRESHSGNPDPVAGFRLVRELG